MFIRSDLQIRVKIWDIDKGVLYIFLAASLMIIVLLTIFNYFLIIYFMNIDYDYINIIILVMLVFIDIITIITYIKKTAGLPMIRLVAYETHLVIKYGILGLILFRFNKSEIEIITSLDSAPWGFDGKFRSLPKIINGWVYLMGSSQNQFLVIKGVGVKLVVSCKNSDVVAGKLRQIYNLSNNTIKPPPFSEDGESDVLKKILV